jgi:hypothetical protein
VKWNLIYIHFKVRFIKHFSFLFVISDFICSDEQERVQKKTFTKWVNIYLCSHEPPYNIKDLYEDFKDGTKLIALLEVLSGQTLVNSE